MARGKNKKQGENRGKAAQASRHTTATATAIATAVADVPSPMSTDEELVLGYFDLFDYCLHTYQSKRFVYPVMHAACLFHNELSFLHYWRAAAALDAAYHIDICFKDKKEDRAREDLVGYLSTARQAAKGAAMLCPFDMELRRFYIDILVEVAIFEKSSFNEAIEQCQQVLSFPEEIMVLEEKFCLRKKETTIEAIRERRNWIEKNKNSITGLAFPLLRPVCFYRRVDKGENQQKNRKELMPETEQKHWRRSCWDSMSDQEKVEFLSMKYEDLRTFFLDGQHIFAWNVLMKALVHAVNGSSKLWCCYICNTVLNDYESHMQHVRTKHIGSLPEHLQELLPEEGVGRTSLPAANARKFLLSFDPAKLILHMFNGTLGEVSFDPDFLKGSLPDPDAFISWLNLDKYIMEKREDLSRQEDAKLGLLKNNFNELELLCRKKHYNLAFTGKPMEIAECLCLEELKKMEHQKTTVLEVYETVQKNQHEELAITKDDHEKAIAIQSQLEVISDLIQSERALEEDTGVVLSLEQLEVLITSLFKSKKEIFAKECEDIESKIRMNITRSNQLESELSRTCLVDYSEHLLPHLGLFLKVRLADSLQAHAKAQSQKSAERLILEEAKKDAVGGSDSSKQLVKNTKKKNKKKERVSKLDICYDTHQQEAAPEIMSSTKVDDLLAKSSQQTEELQIDSCLEQERKLEKGQILNETKENVIKQSKEEETTTPFNSIAQEQSAVGLSSAVTDKDADYQEVGTSSAVRFRHPSTCDLDVLVKSGNSKSEEEHELDTEEGWTLVTRKRKSAATQCAKNSQFKNHEKILMRSTSEHPDQRITVPLAQDDPSTDASELVPSDADAEDVFLTMLNDSIKQRHLSNVIILPLCELKPFQHELGMKLSLHNDVGKPCVVCELGDIVIAFGKESSRERAVNSILGRFSFSYLLNDSCHQQQVPANQAHYNAPDVLLAIFDCFHESFTPSGDSAAELNEKTSMSLCLCNTGTCLMHELFGINIDEVTKYPCGLKARHEKLTFFHSVSAKELCSMKVTSIAGSFKEILRKVILSHQFVCQPTCCCRKYSNLYQNLLYHPKIFIAVVNWEIDNSADDISATLEIISNEIDLSALYDGVKRRSKYLLQSMICCSLKYVCFIHDFEHESWFLYNGENMEEIGGWDAVVSKCEVRSFRPEVLMYVSRDG